MQEDNGDVQVSKEERKNPSITHRDPAKQGHRTPREFLDAVERRFGHISFDLAATDGHEVSDGPHCAFSPEQDSLAQSWAGALGQTVWLNPPFANIRPWVRKLDEECQHLQRWTLCLIPASMGSHWWNDHVLGKCFALGITRMTFVGSTTPYPKDLALLCYGFGVSGHGFWDWKGDVNRG